MDEEKWLAETKTGKSAFDVIDNMPESYFDRVSDRKWRLFACACGRSLWGSMRRKRSRKCLEVAELFADGLATAEELREAQQAAFDPLMNEPDWPDGRAEAARNIAYEVGDSNGFRGAYEATSSIDSGSEHLVQRSLLWCVIGQLVTSARIKRAWLTSNEGTVSKLAESIYADRAFDRLPILADALEEAGCTNADILAHCRGPGPHVPAVVGSSISCWANSDKA